MFKQSIVKIFAIVAIVVSAVGFLTSALGIFMFPTNPDSGTFFIGIATWGLFLWASILSLQLCKSYTLYETEYKRVGIAVYSILFAFILYFFFGIIAGLVVSVIITARVWALKSNYDDWNEKTKRRSSKIVLTKNEESTNNEDNITT